MKALKIGLVITLVAGLVFVVADCSGGKSKHIEAYVFDHEYHEAWTEISHHTDSEGHSYTTTTHHPEEFHLIVVIHGGHNMDLDVGSAMYSSVTNGQDITLKVREGYWTGWNYLPQVQP